MALFRTAWQKAELRLALECAATVHVDRIEVDESKKACTRCMIELMDEALPKVPVYAREFVAALGITII